MDEWNTRTHAGTGLTERVRASKISEAEAVTYAGLWKHTDEEKPTRFGQGLFIGMAFVAGAGTTDDRVVSFVDFGPTVLSLCGIEPDPRLDGVPFFGAHARIGSGLAFSHADRFDAIYRPEKSLYQKAVDRLFRTVIHRLFQLTFEL